jgi:serine protease Do
MKKKLIAPLIIILIFALTGCSSVFYNLFSDDSSVTPKQTNYTPAFEIVSSEGKEELKGWEVYDKVVPSMVSVINYQGTSKKSEGSGIIMTSSGYIITNAHVIENADYVEVLLYNNVLYTAQEGNFWYDRYTDIGVIKIDATGLSAAEFGDPDETRIGEDVYALGNPGGVSYSHSITKGILSYKYRKYSPIADSGYSVNCLQVDAPINPGNSGGALINVYGQIIGINSAKIADVNFEGMGFSISIKDAQPIVSDLILHSKVRGRPAIGITYMFATVKGYTGARIVSVNDNSNLKGIVFEYDLITEINGVKLTDPSQVAKSLKDTQPGDLINVKYRKYPNYDQEFAAKIQLIEM